MPPIVAKRIPVRIFLIAIGVDEAIRRFQQASMKERQIQRTFAAMHGDQH